MTERPIPACDDPRLEPSSIDERIQTLDLLRGFALFGILLVNMQFFGFPIYAIFGGMLEWHAAIDRIADTLIRFFAEGKFYPLFSFLFGLGFSIQMLRAESREADFVGLYTRRLAVLLLIGLAHALLLWAGDILILYALLGFLLLLFRRRSPRTLLIWAAISLYLPVVLLGLTVGLLELSGMDPQAGAEIEQQFAERAAETEALAREATLVYSQGSYAEIMGQRARDLAFFYAASPFFAPSILAMFLLGLYAGRRGVFSDIPAHLAFVKSVLLWGLVLGLVGNAVLTLASAAGVGMQPSGMLLLAVAGQAVGGPAFCFAYVAAITLLLQSETWRMRLSPVAAAGRMALSNYLLQSLIATSIFYSYGLGLYGQVGPAAGAGLTLAIFFLVQLPLSAWWLRRFRFGPAEWLWRSLTYRNWQPLRLDAESAGRRTG